MPKVTTKGLGIILLLWSLPIFAEPFHAEVTLLGQGRQNTREEVEVPLNGYAGAGYQAGRWRGETSFRLFRDLDQGLDDADLYQALLQFQPLTTTSITFGRQFLSEGFSTEMLDGLRAELLPAGPLHLSVYGGIPRTVEEGDFNKDDGLLTGLSIRLKEEFGTRGGLHAAWRKNDWGVADLGRNDELRLGADLSRRWNSKIKPQIYGLAEYNLSSKVLETGTAGLELTAHRRLSVNVEGNYFNANRETNRPSILSLFTQGETISGRFALTSTLVEEWMDFIGSYSYQINEIEEETERKGHLLEAGFPLTFDQLGLLIHPSYYFLNSFGGTVHGAKCSLLEEWNEKFSSELSVDFATYTKITSDNDQAFSTVLWTGYRPAENWKISGGAEYNRNNLFDRDVRGSLKLDYHYGKI
ncbi:MAG: hypothetical protein HY539_04390 [Deltaproteobacteria bacterium]|nr:hypothetical protein [Deltaproteobacteria bacterium]